jgi:putative ABC transport system permease protein
MENWWLQNFAYRIQINGFIIIGSGIVALLIAWFTVSFQSIKAATRNPIESLRNE